jgi:hypothetical protein
MSALMKKPQFFKFIPWRKRQAILMLFAVVAAMMFYIIAGIFWYGIIAWGPADPVYWATAFLATIGGLCSTMTIITGEGSWMLIGLFEW